MELESCIKEGQAKWEKLKIEHEAELKAKLSQQASYYKELQSDADEEAAKIQADYNKIEQIWEIERALVCQRFQIPFLYRELISPISRRLESIL